MMEESVISENVEMIRHEKYAMIKWGRTSCAAPWQGVRQYQIVPECKPDLLERLDQICAKMSKFVGPGLEQIKLSRRKSDALFILPSYNVEAPTLISQLEEFGSLSEQRIH
jgi:hypothetical protein